ERDTGDARTGPEAGQAADRGGARR
ncbi:MAG: hypothetical protein AVDCRST_MAG27-1327, partial [uncultured Craurococcus sp.]